MSQITHKSILIILYAYALFRQGGPHKILICCQIDDDAVTGSGRYEPSVDEEMIEICHPSQKGAFRSSIDEIANCGFVLKMPTIKMADFTDMFLAVRAAMNGDDNCKDPDDKFAAEFDSLKEGRESKSLKNCAKAIMATTIKKLPSLLLLRNNISAAKKS